MMWLAALVLVLFGAGLLLAALVASPRDPVDDLLREPPPWECSRCERAFKSQTTYLIHECAVEFVRSAVANASRGDGPDTACPAARSELPVENGPRPRS